MGEMFKDFAGFEEGVEHRFAVGLVAAPQDVVVGAGDDLDGVELDEAEGVDLGERGIGSRGVEAVGGEPQGSRGGVGDAEGRHGRPFDWGLGRMRAEGIGRKVSWSLHNLGFSA